MRRLIMVFSVVVLLGAVLGYIVLRPLPLFSEVLLVGETEDRGEGRYVVQLYDENGGDIIHITFDVGSIVTPDQNFIPVSIQIWHKCGTQLHQVGMIFKQSGTGQDLTVYLEESPSEVSKLTIHDEVDGYSFHFQNLGFYGKYTVNYHFLIQKGADLPNIALTTQIILHYTTFPQVLTQKQATTTLNI